MSYISHTIFFLTLFFSMQVVAQQPDFGWANSYGQNDFSEEITDMVLDDDGNIYVTGEAEWNTDLDPTSGVISHLDVTTNSFLAKYNPQGNLVWLNALPSSSSNATSMNISPNNELVVVQEDYDWDSTLVLRYDTSGVLLFEKKIQQIDFGSVAIDAQNCIYIAFLGGSGDLDPGPEVVLAGAGSIIKLDSMANFIWAKTFYGFALMIRDMEVSDGIIYCAGDFYDDIDFDPGAGEHILIAEDDEWDNWWADSYAICLDTAGNFNWVKQFANLSQNVAYSIAVDQDNNLYVGGTFQDNIDFDLTSAAGFFDIAEDAIYVCKLSPNGELTWAKLIESSEYTTGATISVDDVGSVYLHGSFNGNLYDNAQTNPLILSAPASVSNGYLLKLDEFGHYKWCQKFTVADGGWVNPSRCRVDHNGDIIAAGYFSGSVDFDGGSTDYILNGTNDLYMVKLIQGPLHMDDVFTYDEGLVVYPNPGNGLFSLTTSHNGVLEIYTISGELISKTSIASGTNQLDLSPFNKGVYLIVVDDENGRRSVLYTKQ